MKHLIRTEITIGVVTVLHNDKIIKSTAIFGDAHEAICTDGPSHGRPVYQRAIEIVMRHLGRRRMTPKLEGMIQRGIVQDGEKLVLLIRPEPDEGN